MYIQTWYDETNKVLKGYTKGEWNEIIVANSSGKVGIGTDTPGALFHLYTAESLKISSC